MSSFELQKARFDDLCRRAMLMRPNTGDSGIGTLGEKRMHAVIKRFLCNDESCHEVKLEGTRFVSDVRIGNHVFEVQTGDFYPMRKKIDHYLNRTDCTVTVIHPIAVKRWISWVDPETMEVQPRRRVGSREKSVDLLVQLAALEPFLKHPRLHFRLLLLETYDFRLLDGRSPDRKKHSTHYERIPLSLLGDLSFNSPADFRSLIPETLPSPFTAKLFSKHAGLQSRDAYQAVRALAALELVTPSDPIGRARAWKTADPNEALPFATHPV